MAPTTMSSFELQGFADRLRGFVRFYSDDDHPQEKLRVEQVAMLDAVSDLLDAFVASDKG